MAFYPSSTPAANDLYVAIDNFASTLNGAIDAVQTTITLVSTAGLPTAGILTIDSEKIHYAGIAGNDLTSVTRGFSSTSAAPHSNGATVSFNVVEEHHNVHSDEIIAIATDLRNAISSDLDDGASVVATAASLKIRLDQIVTQLKAINTGTDWKDAITKRLIDLVALDGSRTLTGDLPAGGFKLTGLGAGTSNGDSLRYEQVIGLYLLLAGGTMSGNIAMGGNKVTGLAAATSNGEALRYEQLINQYLLLAGGTLSGDLDLGGNDLRGVGTLNDTFISGFRNRIVNGAMHFDQRNEGTAYTINAATVIRTLDTWLGVGQAADGIFTVQRLSATPPTGFTHYKRVAVTTADAAIGAAQFYRVGTRLEGTRVRDFLFGTADAKTITLSFWVRSSVTGAFSGAIRNGAGDRSYPFSYTINVADTWEKKSVTLAGDTTGTWATDITSGLELTFDLGSGSDFRTTAGAWTGTSELGVDSAVSLIATLNATLDLTGVQIEVGSIASAFEYLAADTEIESILRYVEKSYAAGTATGTSTSTDQKQLAAVIIAVNNSLTTLLSFKTRKRATPTITLWTPTGTSGSWNWWTGVAFAENARTSTVDNASPDDFCVLQTTASELGARGHFFATAEL